MQCSIVYISLKKLKKSVVLTTRMIVDVKRIEAKVLKIYWKIKRNG